MANRKTPSKAPPKTHGPAEDMGGQSSEPIAKPAMADNAADGLAMPNPKKPMEHFNIADFNRGQSSKLIRDLAEKDKVAYVLKNGKPLAVIISNQRYKRLMKERIDINEY